MKTAVKVFVSVCGFLVVLACTEIGYVAGSHESQAQYQRGYETGQRNGQNDSLFLEMGKNFLPFDKDGKVGLYPGRVVRLKEPGARLVVVDSVDGDVVWVAWPNEDGGGWSYSSVHRDRVEAIRPGRQ